MPNIVVVGSVNLDLVATVAQLPAPGETVVASGLQRISGGKGANQALAARRLGADVALVAAVGDDNDADDALALLDRGGVDLHAVRRAPGDVPTGTAYITVDGAGETTIVVSAGANARLGTDVAIDLALVDAADAVITVLEVPDAAVAAAVAQATGFVVLNAAPPRPVAAEVLAGVDLVVVNSAEYAAIDGLDAAGAVAITSGARGAVLRRGGVEVARAVPPPVTVVDGTGAGDCFTAALTMALLLGLPDAEALRYGCAAGAAAVTRHGAQPSLPTAEDVVALLRGDVAGSTRGG